jgi:hypothetical protein
MTERLDAGNREQDARRSDLTDLRDRRLMMSEEVATAQLFVAVCDLYGRLAPGNRERVAQAMDSAVDGLRPGPHENTPHSLRLAWRQIATVYGEQLRAR